MRRLETLISNEQPEPITPRSRSPTPHRRSSLTPRATIRQPHQQTWISWLTDALGSSSSGSEVYSRKDTFNMTRDIDSLQYLSNLLLTIWPLSLETDDSLAAESGTFSTEDPLLSSSLEEETSFQPVGPGVWAPQVSDSNILTWRGKEQIRRGLRKSTNLDVPLITSARSESVLKTYESRILVKMSVSCARYLESKYRVLRSQYPNLPVINFSWIRFVFGSPMNLCLLAVLLWLLIQI
jgi:hypothetical protein